MQAHLSPTCPETITALPAQPHSPRLLPERENAMRCPALHHCQERRVPVDPRRQCALIYSRPMATPSFLYPEKEREMDRCARGEGERPRLQTRGPVGRAAPSASPAWWTEPIAERRTFVRSDALTRPVVSGYTLSDRADPGPPFPPSKIYGHSSRSGTFGDTRNAATLPQPGRSHFELRTMSACR